MGPGMAHAARKKILCVEDDREIAALGLSASNGTSRSQNSKVRRV